MNIEIFAWYGDPALKTPEIEKSALRVIRP